MKNERALIPTALLVFLAAGVFYTPARQSANGPARAEAPPAAPAPASTAGHEGEAVEAWDMLADYMNVDISPAGIARRVQDAGDLLAAPAGGISTDRADAARLVIAFCSLPFISSAPHVADVKRLGQILAARLAAGSPAILAEERAWLQPLLSPYPGDIPENVQRADIERPARAFSATDLSGLKRQVIAAERVARGLEVNFLVVTVPDPIDSYVGWVFDPFLDTLRRAAEAEAFLMDRFYLPDWSPARPRQGVSPPRTLHERYPGLLLFRARSNPGSLLLVLLVTETPTAGLHQQAFDRAVRVVHDWDPDRSPIRIVGPSFSGTVPSLVSAMRQAQSDMGITFNVMTGVATAPDNRRQIEATGASFGATIHDKKTLGRVAEEFLGGRVLSRGDGDASRYALLSESNTGFGQAAERSAPDQSLRVHFPLHISRLHAARQQQADQGQLRPFGTPALRPLTLDDGRAASDQLPTLWPGLAESATELLVNDVVQTIAADRIRVVGIVATDARDALFLTQQLAEVAPNAVIYGMESDLLYTHPDFAVGTRGMLLVSTYPLYTRNQVWTYPGAGRGSREMFYSSVAEGLYNAILLQLDAGADETPPARDARRVRRLRDPRAAPLEYGFPLAPCSGPCLPPVWVTVVGRDGLWPVRVYRPDALEPAAPGVSRGSREAPYVTGVRFPDGFAADSGGRGFSTPMWVPAWVSGLGCLLVFLLLLHGYAFIRRPVDAPGFFCTFSRPAINQPTVARHPTGTVKHLSACFWALLVVDANVACLFWTWLTAAPHAGLANRLLAWIGGAAIGASLVLLLYAALWLIRALALEEAAHIRRCVAAERHEKVRRLAQTIVRCGLAGVGILSLWSYAAYLVDVVSSAPKPAAFTPDQANSVLWYERSVNVLNGVSPTLPLLALAAAVYLWGVQGLRRRVPHEDVKLDVRMFLADDLTLYAPDPRDRRRQAVARLVVSGAVAAVYVLALREGVLAYEGRAYAAMYFWGGLLAELLVATSLVSLVFYWRAIQARLCRLEDHPVLQAFTRVSPNLVTPRNLIQTPRLTQVFPLADRARRLALARPTADGGGFDLAGAIARQPEFRSPDPQHHREAEDVWRAFSCEVSTCGADRWTSSETWRKSRALVRLIVEDLRPQWDLRRSLVPARSLRQLGAAEAQPTTVVKVADELRAVKEEIVAVHLAFTLREVFAGMAGRAVFCMTTVFLLLASHTFFPFEPHRTLVSIAWMNVLVVTIVGLLGLFGLERDAVLQAISRTGPGDQHATATLVWRVTVFAVIPLLSLLAVEFPEIGTAVIQWLEPMQKAL